MRPRLHEPPGFFDTVRGRRLLQTAAFLAATFGVGYAVASLWFAPPELFAGQHPIPRVIDYQVSDALERLTAETFTGRVVEERAHATIPKNAVAWQDPAPGTIAPQGTVVRLVLSAGPTGIAVPDVTGLDASLATRVIVAAGLAIGKVDSVPGGERGVVTGTRPLPGVARDAGTHIDLIVGTGG